MAFFKFIDFEYRIFNVEIDRGFEICINGIDTGEVESRHAISLDCGLIQRSVASMLAIRVFDPAVAILKVDRKVYVFMGTFYRKGQSGKRFTSEKSKKTSFGKNLRDFL